MKELDKDALLEEAKKRYPVGTKFKSALRGDKHPFQTIVKGNIYLDKVEGRQVIWNGDGCGFIYDNGNWAEIIEEPKVETKFEKGKWYELKYLFNGKPCNTLAKSTNDSINEFRFEKYYDLEDKKWRTAVGFSIDPEIEIIYIKELLLQEIQQYLPADHPDKIKQEVKEEVKPNITWKIGDYVVFTEDWCRSRKGDIDKIKNLSSDVVGVYLEKEGLAGSPLYKECKLKVFPTLQEAQKFSDELLGKSKTNLNVEDLIEGEFYRHNENGNIFKWATPKQFYLGDGSTTFNYGNGNWDGEFSLATPAEKKWLKTCIKQDKFIPKEELDKYDDEGNLINKTPEYVKYIKGEDIGKIVKVIKWTSHSYCCVEFSDGTYKEPFKHLVEPSTKSAYDAQFKKDEDYKVGDYVITKGYSSSYDGRILKIRKIESNEYCYFEVFDGGYFGKQHSFSITDILRKALPHEIPVENSVKENPITLEECCEYPVGADSVTALGWGIYEQIERGFIKLEGVVKQKKTPDLIDKSKVEVKIKRTKVKQIKL